MLPCRGRFSVSLLSRIDQKLPASRGKGGSFRTLPDVDSVNETVMNPRSLSFSWSPWLVGRESFLDTFYRVLRMLSQLTVFELQAPVTENCRSLGTRKVEKVFFQSARFRILSNRQLSNY